MSNFIPHAIIVCENRVPSPIFVAAVLGVDKLLKIDFPSTIKAEEYASFAIEDMHARLRKWGGSAIPSFGKPIAIVVNYAETNAVKYDMQGRPIEKLSHVWSLGEAILTV